MGTYDVIVVGAGHAGCEAALAAARMKKHTLLLTISPESIAMMPCNPSIGGTGKGQLVKEIDALGGEMGCNIDKTFIQFRMLNASKGPAVWSPRAQADKQRYHEEMKYTLERQENLDLKQGEVVDLMFEDVVSNNSLDGSCVRRIAGVLLKSGSVYRSNAVILATGTYLNGLVHVSDRAWSSGPSGMTPSIELAENLERAGIHLRRFKTGTPARVLAGSLDYSIMDEQKGDEPPLPFSYMNDTVGENKTSCWLTWTNEHAHEIVAANIEKTAPYGGYTTGVGPRYCLSIEDKVSRFPDRKRHQLFLEPEGLSTEEVYVQGMSTSLPEEIQERFYRSIEGLENAKISRYAYSIEYDCIDPLSLTGSLAYKGIAGLFFAGQINGSSGYEEAAAQGLVAGINAALHVDQKPPWSPDRSQSYIGVLVDDLVTKGTNEPYRIMTSRAEFRLVLRQDNADLRLTEIGYGFGLATAERYERFMKNKRETDAEILRLNETYVSAEEAAAFLAVLGAGSVSGRISLAELLRRPEVTHENLSVVDPARPAISKYAETQSEIEIKYEGYIAKQKKQIENFRKLENKRIPCDLDYTAIRGLRNESVQKLGDIRPDSVGQASRISGVSPADINVLLVYLTKLDYERKRA
ncbi:MAG: tRNA uridine-5-carboxymethylaminomethyl(34) synthesis enzyme MnmG [Clostridiales Family XIII bacterium]|jgi:tRNA uridine 5-carboxymethylaminomethyl modification enzyme|nr:tRNA uridine-5-carboxymethylaminomethyl(34) synthesis enzyme MnmG [Clostridiales Family XIII bacterium]